MTSDRRRGGERRIGERMPDGSPVPRRRRTDQINHHLSPIGIVSRVVGDAVIAFVAAMTALVVQAYMGAQTFLGTAESLAAGLVPGGIVLIGVFVCAVTVANTLFGVYSRQRTYPMRTKLVRLAQSTALAGAAAGVVLWLLPDALAVPRAAFVGTWLLAVMALPASRWWAWAYRLDVYERQLRQDMQRRLASERSGDDVAADDDFVLVIGGAGYIGSALLPRLLESGRKVRLLDVFMYGDEAIAPWRDHPNLEVVEADYRRFEKLVGAMQGVKTVVHLGGLVGDPACAWNEALTVEVNLTFTRVIAEVAKASGVEHFVFASTCSVYGASDEILDESSRLNPVSLYARSKIGSERVLHELEGPGFGVTILRFGTIYGLSGRTRFDLVVNLLVAKAHVDHGITVFGGDQWRPFLHVDDAAMAVAMVLEAPRDLVSGRVYNVGSDEQNATLGEVGRMINQLVPEAEYVDSGRDGDRRNYRVSFKRVRDEIGFVPQWSLEAGARQVLEALRSGRVGDYRDPQYSNVRYLTERTDAVYLTTESDYSRGLIDGQERHEASASAASSPTREVDRIAVAKAGANTAPAPVAPAVNGRLPLAVKSELEVVAAEPRSVGSRAPSHRRRRVRKPVPDFGS